jgi:cytochrome b
MLWVALAAAGAMVVQDILSVLLVQAEARNHAWLSGLFDSLSWLAAITTTTISVTTLQGHNLEGKVLVVVLVSAANVLGSAAGVALGERFITTAGGHRRRRLAPGRHSREREP